MKRNLLEKGKIFYFKNTEPLLNWTFRAGEAGLLKLLFI